MGWKRASLIYGKYLPSFASGVEFGHVCLSVFRLDYFLLVAFFLSTATWVLKTIFDLAFNEMKRTTTTTSSLQKQAIRQKSCCLRRHHHHQLHWMNVQLFYRSIDFAIYMLTLPIDWHKAKRSNSLYLHWENFFFVKLTKTIRYNSKC